MKPFPIWFDGQQATHHPAARGTIEADVAVIGAGMAGLHAALRLHEAGRSVVLLEARRVGRQATGRSTAKVTSQHGVRYRALIRSFGAEAAQAYATAHEAAVRSIAGLARGMQASAGLEEARACIYAADDAEAQTLRDELEACTSLGLPAAWAEDAGLPFATDGALCFSGQYQFDPYLYASGLAARLAPGVRVFEESRVTEVRHGEPCRVTGEGFTVAARDVVVATHLPMIPEGSFFAKAHPFAHPVVAAPLPEIARVDGMFISAGTPSHSFRLTRRGGETFIVASGREYAHGEEGAAQAALDDLRGFLKDAFGVDTPTHQWTNHDFRPMDGVPFAGAVSGATPHLHVATGFAAWGITGGAVAGDVIAAGILGQPHPCAGLFDARRIDPVRSAGRFVQGNLRAGAHLVADKFGGTTASSLAEIRPGGGAILSHDGEKLAVHKDLQGEVHAVSAICTHMGCVIGWNAVESTWDCPCHGSRFDVEGRVIAGPAAAPLARHSLGRG